MIVTESTLIYTTNGCIFGE